MVQFPFAFVLLFAHGLASRSALPSLGLLPLAMSAVLSAYDLNLGEVAISGSPIFMSSGNIIAIGVAIIFFHLTVLVPSWIHLTHNHWRNDNSILILGVYGTVFQLLDL
jgi:hypothetical protein